MANPVTTEKDLVTLATFIRLYCLHNHGDEVKRVVHLNTHDLPKMIGRQRRPVPQLRSAPGPRVLQAVGLPLDPKPACKHCPKHCYHPSCRAQIREVMKFSGRRLLLVGAADYLLHLLF